MSYQKKKIYDYESFKLWISKVLLPLIQWDIIVLSIPVPHPPAAGCQDLDELDCGRTTGIYSKRNDLK